MELCGILPCQVVGLFVIWSHLGTGDDLISAHRTLDRDYITCSSCTKVKTSDFFPK